MGFKAFTFDESFKTAGMGGGGRPYCTEGYYLFEVTGVSPSKENLDDDKWSYWAWALRIVEGPSNLGRSWTDFGTMEPEKMAGNKRKLLALGKADTAAKLGDRTVASHEDFIKLTTLIAASVKGRKFGALVGDGRPYNGKATSDIMEHLSEDEYRERVKLLEDSGGAVAVSNGPPSSMPPAGAAGMITPESVESLLGDLDI